MTVESGYAPTERESAPRPTTQSTPEAQPVYYHSARHGNHVEESPELLRWRADLLMDEMMIGAVDVSASDSTRTFSGVDAPVTPRPQSSTSSPVTDTSSNDDATRGYSPRAYDTRSYNTHENGTYEDGRLANGHPPAEPYRSDPHPAHYTGGDSNGRDSNGGYGHDTPERNGFAYHVHDTADHGDDQGYERNGRSSKSVPQRSRLDSFTSDPRTESQNHASRPETSHPETNRGSDVSLRQSSTRPSPPTSLTKSSYDYDEGGAEHASDYRFDDDPVDRIPNSRDFIDRDLHHRDLDHQDSNRGNPNGREGYVPRQVADRLGEERARGLENDPRERRSAPDQSLLRTPMDNVPVTHGGDQTPRVDRLYSVEQQYEQFRREQISNVQPVPPTMPTAPTSRPAPSVPSGTISSGTTPSAPPRVTPQPVDEHTQWATEQEKWEWQDFSADPDEPEDPLFFGGSPVEPERTHAHDSAVRHDPSQFTNAMSFISSNKKRSTLLPRMSTLDVDTLNRQISDLHGDIAALLPVGNETGERARHLLDKAYSIMQSDPMRSAEVEYYMQQVRTIVQRLHQARQWSDLYRKRLHIYLLAWLGLSAVVVLARFLFQAQMEGMLSGLFGLQDGSLLLSHWATFVGTAFAGALGGAVGALYTMQTHARGEYSFFDRKYGLRGLILPIIGLIVGALGYLIFGVVFALVGIDPSQNLVAAIIPTLAAFAFGFSQESIYGTRG